MKRALVLAVLAACRSATPPLRSSTVPASRVLRYEALSSREAETPRPDPCPLAFTGSLAVGCALVTDRGIDIDLARLIQRGQQ